MTRRRLHRARLEFGNDSGRGTLNRSRTMSEITKGTERELRHIDVSSAYAADVSLRVHNACSACTQLRVRLPWLPPRKPTSIALAT